MKAVTDAKVELPNAKEALRVLKGQEFAGGSAMHSFTPLRTETVCKASWRQL